MDCFESNETMGVSLTFTCQVYDAEEGMLHNALYFPLLNASKYFSHVQGLASCR